MQNSNKGASKRGAKACTTKGCVGRSSKSGAAKDCNCTTKSGNAKDCNCTTKDCGDKNCGK